MPIDALVFGLDDHPVGHLGGAGGGQAAPALDLDQAGPARAGGLEPRVVAQGGDLQALAAGHVQDGFPGLGGDALALEFDVDRFGHGSGAGWRTPMIGHYAP